MAQGTLALIQCQMALAQIDASAGPVELSAIESIITDKKFLAYALALEQLARHNTRLGQRSEMLALAETVDEANKPFVQIGVAVGAVEPQK
jgi:hypothetical protein